MADGLAGEQNSLFITWMILAVGKDPQYFTTLPWGFKSLWGRPVTGLNAITGKLLSCLPHIRGWRLKHYICPESLRLMTVMASAFFTAKLGKNFAVETPYDGEAQPSLCAGFFRNGGRISADILAAGYVQPALIHSIRLHLVCKRW